MRFIAILPVLLVLISLILTFLCIFAGSSRGFMEDYALLTLNTSRFGEQFLATASNSGDSGNPITNLLNNITNSIETGIDDEINSIARQFGLHDWYSLHVLDYCEGYYVPGPLPNATVTSGDIWENVTACSNHTALFNFNLRSTLQQELDDTGHGYINISQLDFPSQVESGINDFREEVKATFVLYCIAIGLLFVAFFSAILSFFLNGRVYSFVNVVIDALACVALLIASALVTAFITQTTANANLYGNDAGIVAYSGSRFLALTWVATVLVLVASIVWCFDCVVGRKDKSYRRAGKHG